MCTRCEKIVIQDMGIKESDLTYLPYKLYRWYCIVPGCRCYGRVKDYGISPFFFDPCKRWHSKKLGKWKGGWFEATGHFRVCSRHWAQEKEIGMRAFVEKHKLNEIDTYEYRLSKLVEAPKKK